MVVLENRPLCNTGVSSRRYLLVKVVGDTVKLVVTLAAPVFPVTHSSTYCIWYKYRVDRTIIAYEYNIFCWRSYVGSIIVSPLLYGVMFSDLSSSFAFFAARRRCVLSVHLPSGGEVAPKVEAGA